MGEFYGQSYLVDPRGQFVVMGSRDKDEVVVGDMDRDVIREVRNTWQFYRDRRPTATATWSKYKCRLMPEPTQVQIGDVVVLTAAPSEASSRTTACGTRTCDRVRSRTFVAGTKFASLWVGMCLCIPTYALAGGMIAAG